MTVGSHEMDWELIGLVTGLCLFSGITTIAWWSGPSPLEYIFAAVFAIAFAATAVIVMGFDFLLGDVPRSPAEITRWLQRTEVLQDAVHSFYRISVTSAALCLWVASVRIWCLRQALWSRFRTMVAERNSQAAVRDRSPFPFGPFSPDGPSTISPRIVGKPSP